MAAFRQRQQEDLARWRGPAGRVSDEGEGSVDGTDEMDEMDESGDESGSSEVIEEELWRNREGDRLKDFGVDEETETYDADDVPLAQLVGRRRK